MLEIIKEDKSELKMARHFCPVGIIGFHSECHPFLFSIHFMNFMLVLMLSIIVCEQKFQADY